MFFSFVHLEINGVGSCITLVLWIKSSADPSRIGYFVDLAYLIVEKSLGLFWKAQIYRLWLLLCSD